MPPQRRPLDLLLAFAFAAVFLVAALDRKLYPFTLHIPAYVRHLTEALNLSSLPLFDRFDDVFADNGWSLRLLVRKAYSVVAFAVVGFFVARFYSGQPLVKRLALTALLVAGFSTCIELVQHFAGSTESYASNVFDIACGALGGVIGTALQSGLSYLRDRHARQRANVYLPEA